MVAQRELEGQVRSLRDKQESSKANLTHQVEEIRLQVEGSDTTMQSERAARIASEAMTKVINAEAELMRSRRVEFSKQVKSSSRPYMRS